MDAKQQAGCWPKSAFIVGYARPIRGANLAQNCARLLHDLRDAKAAADFNEFSTRNDDLGLLRKGIQPKKRRRRTVVHDNDAIQFPVRIRGGSLQYTQYKALNMNVSAA